MRRLCVYVGEEKLKYFGEGPHFETHRCAYLWRPANMSEALRPATYLGADVESVESRRGEVNGGRRE